MDKKLTMLMILDGFGENENQKGNAVKLANTPNIDKLMKTCPTTDIYTSGLNVGLPDGQMGNSEVGHTNIGAGRIVYQELTRITKSIEDGDFFSIPEFVEAIENCKKNNSKLHIMGLLSDGGVHSHIRHLFALLELAKRRDFEDVYVHCFLDGRDTPRFYSMDRDKRWQRIQKTYDAMVNGNGEKSSSAISAIESSYQKEIFDEFVVPTVITNGESPVATIENNDSVIFFNFRPDRAREITRTLVDKEFNEFKTKKMNLYFVCMTPYDETMPNVKIAFKKERLANTFGEYISNLGYTQLRIAETEKYAHVTFFFNGGEEKQYKGEDRILVPSPKVETYDLKPEMSAIEVTDKVIDAIESGKYNNIIYGNSEQMIDYKTGEPHTAHTTNPVPLILYGMENVTLNSGKLADLAPTMLDIMDLPKPEEMTGESIIVRK